MAPPQGGGGGSSTGGLFSVSSSIQPRKSTTGMSHLSRLSEDDQDLFENESHEVHTIEVKNGKQLRQQIGLDPDGIDDLSTEAGNQKGDLYEEVAYQESINVFRLRVMVILVLLGAAIIVSAVVYLMTTKGEYETMVSAFAGSAEKITTAFEQIVSVQLGAITSLGTAFTSYARGANLTWPYITLNDFQQRATGALFLSNALYVELIPIVSEQTRTEWEAYSVQNKAWLDTGRAWQAQLNPAYHRFLQEQHHHQTERRETSSTIPQNLLSSSQASNNNNNINNNNYYYNSSSATSSSSAAASSSGAPPGYPVPFSHSADFSSSIAKQIFMYDASGQAVVDPGPGPYYPVWEESPILPFPKDLVNFNLLRMTRHTPYLINTATTASINLGQPYTSPPGGTDSSDMTTSFNAFIQSFAAGKAVDYIGDPMSSVYVPVFDSFEIDRNPVAILVAIINWGSYFQGVLPTIAQPVYVVLKNSCNGTYTYTVDGTHVKYLGSGDLHDTTWTYLQQTSSFHNISSIQDSEQYPYPLNQETCYFNVSVYPTKVMVQYYTTNRPIVITFSVVMVFFFTSIMFLIYDRLVEKRQEVVMKKAERTSALVSSLFPQQIRARLFADDKNDDPLSARAQTRLKTFLSQSIDRRDDDLKSKPIADLFTETTVLFADIAGFTAWSSVREPAQVFTLLETLYHAFDELAKKRRVFKVETVGDCYVAVTGLPDPDPLHAISMARFAMDCMNKMHALTRQLEISLGPDTGDLDMRMGMHSGPVTAGVLRGERSRFQLFGDTMNTAARMESTSLKGRIQLSQEAADRLVAAGKRNWIMLRETTIVAKGKGEMQTYWLHPTKRHAGSEAMTATDGSIATDADEDTLMREDDIFTVHAARLSSDKVMRLIEWNVDVLARLLKHIIARRKDNKVRPSILMDEKIAELQNEVGSAGLVIDEVKEIIMLPGYDAKQVSKQEDIESMELDSTITKQLHQYVTNIAALYRDNPFHNFEHASHVTMSVTKLLSRIVAPSEIESNNKQTLHDHTYGITSDPLTQFACVFSALIHDVDHSGVPNMQLVQENAKVAQYYKNKSVAEQNSVDLAWQVLMDDSFFELRKAIYSTDSEFKRFRQLVVNSVMATDIVDKELKDLRNARWARAFSEDAHASETERVAVNRKATIVIEHLIQASDVSHTMQHWHIYRKWNERFFLECYKAFLDGRAATDPSDGWYKGEMGFYDFYIIPLAKKLKDCGVFGVSSDEYLNYAVKNRQEWERRGQEVVAEMLETAKAKLQLE